MGYEFKRHVAIDLRQYDFNIFLFCTSNLSLDSPRDTEGLGCCTLCYVAEAQMTHARFIGSSNGCYVLFIFCCRRRRLKAQECSAPYCDACLSEDAVIWRNMACVTRLKDDTRFLECTFPRSHKLFQILSASVDEVVCRFIAAEQDTRPVQSVVLTANFGVC